MVDTDKLFFYEAVTQQLLDDEYVQPTLTTAFHLTRSPVNTYGEVSLEEAVDVIKRQMKVEPNSMLRKDHLYNIFKNCAYLSSRTVVEAELSDEHLDRDKGVARINEIVHEYANLNIEEQYNYKVMAYNNFAEFQNFKVRFKLVRPATEMIYRNSLRLQDSISLGSRRSSPCRCVSQSSDSSLVAIGGVSGSLHVTPFVDTNDPVCKRKPNGMCTSRLHGHSEQVDAIDFHPKRNILASGGIDCNIVLHDINAANGYVYSVAELR